MPSVLEKPAVPYSIFCREVRTHMHEKQYARINFKINVGLNKLDNSSIVSLYEDMVTKVSEGIPYYEKKLQLLQQYKEHYKALESTDEDLWERDSDIGELGELDSNIEEYGVDANNLESNLQGELVREARYLSLLQSMLSDARGLSHLCSLDTVQLIAAAKSNYPYAKLIMNTPELLGKIPNKEFANITHSDRQIAHSLAQILASQEYTHELHSIFMELRKQVSGEDEDFIIQQQDECLTQLLLKVKQYIEAKIDRGIRDKKNPWALGYFGSRYQLTHRGQMVEVPQGIYEIQSHLSDLGKIPPQQILASLQTTIQSKLDDIADDSIMNQIIKFVNYLFGRARSQETIDEYQHMSTMGLIP
jgi:hypothetical protein